MLHLMNKLCGSALWNSFTINSVKLLLMFHLVHEQVRQQSTFGKLEETNRVFLSGQKRQAAQLLTIKCMTKLSLNINP